MNVTHKLDGVEVNPPLNFSQARIEINNSSDGFEDALAIKELQFIEGGADILYNKYDSGTIGGNGIIEGVKYDVTFELGGTIKEFNLIIDLTTATFGRDIVTAEAKPLAGVDWLNDSAEVSFEYMADLGLITKDDYTFIPYIISSVPDYKESFLTVLTITVVGIELKRSLSDVQKAATESASVLGSVGGIINLIGSVAYAAILIITILDLILDLFALIIQKVKYIPSMYAKDLVRIGADKIGLQVDYGVLNDWDDLVIVPPMSSIPSNIDDDRIKGFTLPSQSDATGYYKGTFAQFLRDLKPLLNAKYSVVNKVLKIGTKGQVPTTARFQIQDYDQVDFTTNANTYNTGYNLNFAYDINDKNTIDNWKGNNVDVTLRPSTVIDETLLMLKNHIIVSIPFARGFRKKELTTPEKIAQVLLGAVSLVMSALVLLGNAALLAVNAVIGFIKLISTVFDWFGIDIPIPDTDYVVLKGEDLSGLIEDRLGMLLLENDQTTVHKALLIKEASNARLTKVKSDNETRLTAKNIYETYYKSANRQGVFRTYTNVEMNIVDALEAQQDEAVKLPDGSLAELVSLLFDGDETGGLAEIKAFEPRIWNNSLVETIIEPNGR